MNPTQPMKLRCKAVKQARAESIAFLLAVGGGSRHRRHQIHGRGHTLSGRSVRHPGSVRKHCHSGPTLRLRVDAAGQRLGNEQRQCYHAPLHQCQTALFKSLDFPKFSVLDPTKTFSLPAGQIGNGVVDTFVHILEQYLTYPAGGKIQDRFAEGLLLTLIEDGPQASG